MNEYKICIIGLGYVGLPLAVEFGKKFETIGFDINKIRVNELINGIDKTLEVDSENLKQSLKLEYTTDINKIKDCNIYIITVPTPIDKYKKPDLSPLISANKIVGNVLTKNDIVIYESTVYPGCTEEDCVPVLEKESGLIFNIDFFCGYSPERINPGDKEHTLKKIKKITSGSNLKIAKKVDELYKSIILETYMAPSIKVAEAAKVIENSQRDINIAFVNELSMIFNKMNIDTQEVLKAAETKWNFLKFKPGIVGGHCIGVDPYYLTYKAESLGYHPEIILAGRRINDNMGIFVANQVIKLMINKGHKISGSKVLILGITFKENCPDIRNSRVIDIYNELKDFDCNIDVCDPWADKEEVKNEYGINLLEKYDKIFEVNYDSIIIAVAHDEFHNIKFESLKSKKVVIYDLKGSIVYDKIDGKL